MSKVKKPRYKLLHQYYKYTGFYRFIWEAIKQAILPTIIIIAILFYVNYKIINLNEGLIYITQNFSDLLIFSIFLASESILGLIPPDIFIAWTKKYRLTTTLLVYFSVFILFRWCYCLFYRYGYCCNSISQ